MMECIPWLKDIPYMGWFFSFWKWQGSPLTVTTIILFTFCIKSYRSEIFPTVYQFIELIAYSLTLVASSKMFLAAICMQSEAWVTYTGAAVTGLVAFQSLNKIFGEAGIQQPEIDPNYNSGNLNANIPLNSPR